VNRLIRLWMLVVLACGLSDSAFGQPVPRVPAVDVSTPNRLLDIKAGDLCAVDFRNIRMFGENANWSAHLKNGKYERKSGSNFEAAKLGDVFCFRHQDGGQRALVTTDWMDCGGSCTRVGVVQLFELRASQPVITQQFAFDSHAQGTGATFNEKSLTLTITGRSDDQSPNCCAQNLDVVTYQWEANEFRQTTYQRVPAPESPLLLTLQYDKVDLPSMASSTCLLVFRDGRFQMGRALTQPPSGTPRFFEDSLPDESLKALHAILEAQEFRELGTVETLPRVAIRQGETLSAVIHRVQTEQRLLLVAVESPTGPAPKLLPAPVVPLVEWVQATSKAINQRKLLPLKNAKSSGTCWLDKH
jgi:hypothetical protein